MTENTDASGLSLAKIRDEVLYLRSLTGMDAATSQTTTPWCVRCDYGPNHDKDGCRGWQDADEPCRNLEPEAYEDATDE